MAMVSSNISEMGWILLGSDVRWWPFVWAFHVLKWYSLQGFIGLPHKLWSCKSFCVVPEKDLTKFFSLVVCMCTDEFSWKAPPPPSNSGILKPVTLTSNSSQYSGVSPAAAHPSVNAPQCGNEVSRCNHRILEGNVEGTNFSSTRVKEQAWLPHVHIGRMGIAGLRGEYPIGRKQLVDVRFSDFQRTTPFEWAHLRNLFQMIFGCASVCTTT